MYYQGTKSVIHMSLLNEVKDDLQVGVGGHQREDHIFVYCRKCPQECCCIIGQNHL